MSNEITTILGEWSQGDKTALDRLAPLVYPQLRLIAAAYLRREDPAHTLQATGLVHEIFLKLIGRRKPLFENRAHFFALAAKLMRMALIDHARGVSAGRRGGGRVAVPLHEEMPWVDAAGPNVLDLDLALDELETLDAEQARMIELRFILGCSVEETAEALSVSKSSVDRKVRLARGWLYQRLNRSDVPDPDFSPSSP